MLVLPVFAADAETLFKRARQAEQEGDDITAFLLYMQARANDPSSRRFVEAAESVRQRAAHTLAALGNFSAAQKLDPSSPSYLNPEKTDQSLSAREFKPAPRLKPPVELQPKDKGRQLPAAWHDA